MKGIAAMDVLHRAGGRHDAQRMDDPAAAQRRGGAVATLARGLIEGMRVPQPDHAPISIGMMAG